ncbi:hypothetical protein BVG19_g659 [[Candida] boidinii]|nr:hypothetical protein BVG19_g659 [[Candida] boidinii]OWB51888.1 hypothetical protein B5S27_g3458 [[Candida] boidinii]OWB85697.1 hypothetical protein B5S33_g4368 [[Candida] boidinii]
MNRGNNSNNHSLPLHNNTTPNLCYTEEERESIRNALDRQLGPEFISTRPGQGGTRVSYIEGWKAINLANEIFGFNGWSSDVRDIFVDYVDESQGRISLGLSAVVRITLKDGTYREDIGYGHIENARTKAMAFEKAKKEAVTDGMKRALRCYGNALGNCLYDKSYLSKIVKVKANPKEFDEDSLMRHDTIKRSFTNPYSSNSMVPYNQNEQLQQKSYNQPNQIPSNDSNRIVPKREDIERRMPGTSSSSVTRKSGSVNNIKTNRIINTNNNNNNSNNIKNNKKNNNNNNDSSKILYDQEVFEDSFMFSDDLPDSLHEEAVPDSEPDFMNEIDDYEMDLLLGKNQNQSGTNTVLKLENNKSESQSNKDVSAQDSEINKSSVTAPTTTDTTMNEEANSAVTSANVSDTTAASKELDNDADSKLVEDNSAIPATPVNNMSSKLTQEKRNSQNNTLNETNNSQRSQQLQQSQQSQQSNSNDTTFNNNNTNNLNAGKFFSARLATEVMSNSPISNDKTFNVHFLSPSLKKTSVVDHSKSTPIKRSQIQSLASANKENSGPKRKIGLPLSKLPGKRFHKQ